MTALNKRLQLNRYFQETIENNYMVQQSFIARYNEAMQLL